MIRARAITFTLIGLLAWMALPTVVLAGNSYSKLIIFGDSLSDPGNAFALTGQASVPPYDNLSQFLVPDAPYARGGKHFSNGKTWVEQLAKTLKLNRSAGPAWRLPGVFCNFAVGGARAGGTSPTDLPGQIAFFLGGRILSEPLDDALAVIVIGGNDVRDAVTAFNPADPSAALGIVAGAVTAIVDSIKALKVSGVRKVLVGNVPNIALTPAIMRADAIFPGAAAAAAFLSVAFNDLLVRELAGLGDGIVVLDIFGTITDVAANPSAFGLTNTTTACVMPNRPPFACRKPDEFAFWDGIHPTKVVHAILAGEAEAALAH
ncbi:MAG: SGNH/GDSL hydrolase family protein [Gammaproteobacteria bacterium]|jgi:outer membrane lipase/esterase|nr:SGNH/GDSL hydrolase family protein [Gammaproteobacteria bacterium]